MDAPRPLSPTGLAQLVAEHVADLQLDHPVRIALDGPSWSALDLAPLVADALAAWSRPVVTIRAADYLRPASVRLERGRDAPDAFYDDWLDLAALDREVLSPCGPGGSRRVLPTLWDEVRDRATRADYVDVLTSGVVVVSGWFLLGRGLPFDLSVHVAVSPAARLRRISAESADRELPAFARYDEEVRPAQTADIVVLADDPRRPAVIDRVRPGTR